MRILATPETVEQLFQRIEVDYPFTDATGAAQKCRMPAWRCRSCDWESLMGAAGLPFPHECLQRAVTTIDESF